MINVGIIATGYVGIEIVRLLQNHRNKHKHSSISILWVKISDVIKLENVFDMECEELDIDKISEKADIFITAFPMVYGSYTRTD